VNQKARTADDHQRGLEDWRAPCDGSAATRLTSGRDSAVTFRVNFGLVKKIVAGVRLEQPVEGGSVAFSMLSDFNRHAAARELDAIAAPSGISAQDSCSRIVGSAAGCFSATHRASARRARPLDLPHFPRPRAASDCAGASALRAPRASPSDGARDRVRYAGRPTAGHRTATRVRTSAGRVRFRGGAVRTAVARLCGLSLPSGMTMVPLHRHVRTRTMPNRSGSSTSTPNARAHYTQPYPDIAT
jgi:hypothetical protein